MGRENALKRERETDREADREREKERAAVHSVAAFTCTRGEAEATRITRIHKAKFRRSSFAHFNITANNTTHHMNLGLQRV